MFVRKRKVTVAKAYLGWNVCINDYDAFIKATGKHYVEVQLWTDRYITKEYLIM